MQSYIAGTADKDATCAAIEEQWAAIDSSAESLLLKSDKYLLTDPFSVIIKDDRNRVIFILHQILRRTS